MGVHELRLIRRCSSDGSKIHKSAVVHDLLDHDPIHFTSDDLRESMKALDLAASLAMSGSA